MYNILKIFAVKIFYILFFVLYLQNLVFILYVEHISIQTSQVPFRSSVSYIGPQIQRASWRTTNVSCMTSWA